MQLVSVSFSISKRQARQLYVSPNSYEIIADRLNVASQGTCVLASELTGIILNTRPLSHPYSTFKIQHTYTNGTQGQLQTCLLSLGCVAEEVFIVRWYGEGLGGTHSYQKEGLRGDGINANVVSFGK